MSKQFWGVIVVVVLVLVGIFALSGNKSGSSVKSGGSTGGNSQLTQHIEGQGKSGVALVEYGDYQCPVCGAYFSTVKQVETEYSQKIFFQFRNFPLVSIHQNAFAAARAAEAAALQGKFWEMNNLIYESQAQWSGASDAPPIFDQYAQQFGLNLAKFKSDYASIKVNDLINADMAEGNKLGVQGTPTFYLDGAALDNSQLVDSSGRPSITAFEKLINTEIAKKTGNSSAAAGATSQTQAKQ